MLEGVIDIYMPDFKYHLTDRAVKYSQVKDYPEKVKAALKEMHRQVGGLKTDQQGIAYRGLIIRHLMMPSGLEDTKGILRFIKAELSPDCLVNLMDQYRPAHQAFKYEELCRNIRFETSNLNDQSSMASPINNVVTVKAKMLFLGVIRKYSFPILSNRLNTINIPTSYFHFRLSYLEVISSFKGGF